MRLNKVCIAQTTPSLSITFELALGIFATTFQVVLSNVYPRESFERSVLNPLS